MRTLTRRAFAVVLATACATLVSGCYRKKEPEPKEEFDNAVEDKPAVDETTAALGKAVLGKMVLGS